MQLLILLDGWRKAHRLAAGNGPFKRWRSRWCSADIDHACADIPPQNAASSDLVVDPIRARWPSLYLRIDAYHHDRCFCIDAGRKQIREAGADQQLTKDPGHKPGC
jgi:hypothetical protein